MLSVNIPHIPFLEWQFVSVLQIWAYKLMNACIHREYEKSLAFSFRLDILASYIFSNGFQSHNNDWWSTLNYAMRFITYSNHCLFISCIHIWIVCQCRMLLVICNIYRLNCLVESRVRTKVINKKTQSFDLSGEANTSQRSKWKTKLVTIEYAYFVKIGLKRKYKKNSLQKKEIFQ